MVTFDNILWLQKFNEKMRCKELRAEIFRQTFEIVDASGYVLNGKKIAVDKTEITANTEFFDKAISLSETKTANVHNPNGNIAPFHKIFN